MTTNTSGVEEVEYHHHRDADENDDAIAEEEKQQHQQQHQKQQQPKGNKKKQKKDYGDPYQQAYRNVIKITKRTSTGRPGTPHRFFKNSYTVSLKQEEEEEENNNNETKTVEQIVHQHANGLCVITASGGEKGDDDHNDKEIDSVEFIAKELSTPMNAGERRKRQSKMLKNASKKNNNKRQRLKQQQQQKEKKQEEEQQISNNINNNNDNEKSSIESIKENETKITDNQSNREEPPIVMEEEKEKEEEDGILYPSNILAKINFKKYTTNKNKNDTPLLIRKSVTKNVYGCVWGNIIEINHKLTPQQIQQNDSLLNGYLAIVMPIGRFPPPSYDTIR